MMATRRYKGMITKVRVVRNGGMRGMLKKPEVYEVIDALIEENIIKGHPTLFVEKIPKPRMQAIRLNDGTKKNRRGNVRKGKLYRTGRKVGRKDRPLWNIGARYGDTSAMNRVRSIIAQRHRYTGPLWKKGQ